MLLGAVEMREAPWILWIADLSVKDPYYVPLLMGATMLIQTKLNPTPPDPMQAKVMMIMPVVFTGMFLFFPAGLVLYWTIEQHPAPSPSSGITHLDRGVEKVIGCDRRGRHGTRRGGVGNSRTRLSLRLPKPFAAFCPPRAMQR